MPKANQFKTLVLNKIKLHLNIKSNKTFADFLEIKPTTLAMWYSRNTYDIELIFKKCKQIDANWLLTGEGDMLKSESINKVYEAKKETLEQSNDNKMITLLESSLKDKDKIIAGLECEKIRL